jgi:hypothetical protein
MAHSENDYEGQLDLFAVGTRWEEEWQGMPEFIQMKQEPYSTLIVRFETKEDLEDFSKRIGQPLTRKTKSIWHPELIRGLNSNKVYKDES